jgi:hypothetical protein
MLVPQLREQSSTRPRTQSHSQHQDTTSTEHSMPMLLPSQVIVFVLTLIKMQQNE